MFKLATAVTIALVPLALANWVAGEQCVSCGWISPEGTKALFMLHNQMESSVKAGKVFELENPMGDDNLMAMMEDVVDIMETDRCNGTLISRMIAMMGRLEEGEDPSLKNKVPYEKKLLVGTLEEHFVRLLSVCLSSSSSMASLTKLQDYVQEFVGFGEVVRSSLEFGAPGAKIGPDDDRRLLGEDPSISPEANLLEQTSQIMSFNSLYGKVHDIWGHYFHADPTDGLACHTNLNENLVRKYQALADQLSDVFKPLLLMVRYSPENFVKIPAEAKKDRIIFEAVKNAKTTYMKRDKLPELIGLHKLLRILLVRAEQYCPTH